jgi:outer membrane protein assembly factor BamD (BamD/ComL family)
MTKMTHRTAHVVAALLLAATCARAQDSLRPEVGKPVQAAQELLKAGKYRDALAKLREADAVPSRTPYENYILDRLRGSAAAGAGDDATATRSFEAALASGRLQSNEQLQLFEALAAAAYRTKDYTRALDWADRYFKQGGTSTQMTNLRTSAHYLKGDYAGVVRDMQQKVDAIEKTPPLVDEDTLRMLAASYAKLGNDAGYNATLEKLLLYHPKKDYWADLLARLPNRPDFNGKLLLDVYRLRFATGTMQDAEEYVEMAQLSIEAGLPAEAKRVVEAGYEAGRLGSGRDAERHQRLRELANKQAAEDERSMAAPAIGRSGDGLVATGAALVAAGKVDKGIEMLELGIAKGGLKRPEEAKLHLARAYLQAGNKAKAIETFKGVRGSDGTADLGRLWVLHANRS